MTLDSPDAAESVKRVEERFEARVHEWASQAGLTNMDAIAGADHGPRIPGTVAIGWWQTEHDGSTSSLFPSIWDEPGSAAVLADYCWQGTNHMLDELSPRLNELHGTDYPSVYWKTFLGSFALVLFSTVVDHRLAFLGAHSLAPEAPFLTCPSKGPPVTAQAWLTRMLRPAGHRDFVSRLAEAMGLPTSPIPDDDVPEEQPPEQRSRVFSVIQRLSHQHRTRTSRILEERLSGLLFGGQRNRRVQMLDCHLSIRQAMTLFIAVRGCRVGSRAEVLYGRQSLSAGIAPDADARSELLRVSAASPAESVVIRLLPHLLPTSVIEGYEMTRRESQRIFGGPSHVVHGNYRWDEVQNEFLARSFVARRRVAFVQHGGSVAQLRVSGGLRLQRRPDAEYVSWGWEGRGVVPLPSARLSRIRDRHRSGSSIVVIDAPTLDQWSVAVINSVDPRKLSGVPRLVAELDNSPLRDNVILKGRGVTVRNEFRLPSAVELMLRARLAVIAYFDTPLLEAFAANVPMIGCWDPAGYELIDETQELLDAMSRVGIFYSDPIDAAKAVERVYHQADEWWAQEQIQEIRHRLLDRYGCSRHWARRWIPYLRTFSRSES